MSTQASTDATSVENATRTLSISMTLPSIDAIDDDGSWLGEWYVVLVVAALLLVLVGIAAVVAWRARQGGGVAPVWREQLTEEDLGYFPIEQSQLPHDYPGIPRFDSVTKYDPDFEAASHASTVPGSGRSPHRSLRSPGGNPSPTRHVSYSPSMFEVMTSATSVSEANSNFSSTTKYALAAHYTRYSKGLDKSPRRPRDGKPWQPNDSPSMSSASQPRSMSRRPDSSYMSSINSEQYQYSI